jgi:hypothetical protein
MLSLDKVQYRFFGKISLGLSSDKIDHRGEFIFAERGLKPPSCNGGSYLDNSVHKSPFQNPYAEPWSKRKRRFFQRAMSGIELAWKNHETVRFLSLTSKPNSPENIHKSFSAFVKRARREFGMFEYLATKESTKSGLAHIHLLYRGSYMPFEWIKTNWSDIHGAVNVYIERVHGNKRQVANYLVKYLGKESSHSYRFWSSSKWCFRGFVGFWSKVVNEYQKNAVRQWKYFLNGGVLRLSRVKWLRDYEYFVLENSSLRILPTPPLTPLTPFDPKTY